eukprot:6194616-Pleurochrysis_carterae.AAC.1
MSCVVFGDGAPKVHWSKKMRPTPAIDARRVMSSCIDMSTCSALPSMRSARIARVIRATQKRSCRPVCVRLMLHVRSC